MAASASRESVVGRHPGRRQRSTLSFDWPPDGARSPSSASAQRAKAYRDGKGWSPSRYLPPLPARQRPLKGLRPTAEATQATAAFLKRSPFEHASGGFGSLRGYVM